MADLKTVDAVIDAFGGTTATAVLFDVLPSAVSNWRALGRFPDRLHFRISREADRRELEVSDALFEPPRRGGMASAAAE
jgi:hypothetical protein